MENDGGGRTRHEPGGLTLGAVLLNKQMDPTRLQDRTLLDLIRSDPTSRKESKKSWKEFRDKIRLKLAGVTWTSTVSVSNRLVLPRGEAPAEGEGGHEPAATEDGGNTAEDAPAGRMSLMALLSDGGSPYFDDDAVEEDEEQEEKEVAEEGQAEESVAGGGGVYNNCCVCMVRHKGAAFIPCGHTFCRLCSREVFVQRGNCPLCNNLILEILDIF